MDAKLHVRTRPELIESVTDFAFKWSMNCGLPRQDSARLALAVDELTTDIVLFAFPEEPNPQTYEVEFRYHVDRLEIIFHELGEPFEPENHPYSPQAFLQEGNFDGAGLHLIRHLVDDFIFFNRGKEGKEFRLIKHIPARHIDTLFQLQDAQEPALSDQYPVTRVGLNDAEDLAKLIYRTWGYTYPRDEMYYPERIRELLERKEKFGVIARTQYNQAVGYFAVLTISDSPIGEVAEAVVSPGHRGRGIMTQMMQTLLNEARQEGLFGVFAEAITTHTASQQVNQRFSFQPTALVLNHFPTLQSKGFKEHQQPRISVLFEFLSLRKRKQIKAYLPTNYRHLLREIYVQLDIDLDEKTHHGALCLPEESELELRVHSRFKTALIIVRTFGADFLETLSDQMQSLKERSYLSLEIDLPLGQPATKKMVPGLNQMGFFLAGLCPLAHDKKDYLRLQHLYSELNPQAIKIHSEFGKKLKRRVIQDYQKWN